MKAHLKIGIVTLLLFVSSCAWVEEEVEVEGIVSRVSFYGDVTRVAFQERPDVIVYQRWDSLKAHEGRKLKLVLMRWKYGIGDRYMTNYYQDLRRFTVEKS